MIWRKKGESYVMPSPENFDNVPKYTGGIVTILSNEYLRHIF